MRKLLVLSGKGGTGKTTVASAFIELSKAKAFADCDVDAPNLHLLGKTKGERQQTDFYGSKKAFIDKTKCTLCGICVSNCRFNAIKPKDGAYIIDEYSCEGCGVCRYVCPQSAVSLVDDIAGELILYKNTYIFSTAKLKMGRGNSGKLVSEVKRQLNDNADTDIAIIDGSPGIGCPVIASVSGVDMVLIVAEPSMSGISDMERILKTIKLFNTDVAVCVNKYDTSIEKTDEVIAYCEKNHISFVGKIPYDKEVSNAINKGLNIMQFPSSAANAMKNVFFNTMEIFLNDKKE